ncbi:hypothetical protein [Streptomyces xinghaiensis]|nr:hypothetical protein [Streptomyces xinghaiensis]
MRAAPHRQPRPPGLARRHPGATLLVVLLVGFAFYAVWPLVIWLI